MLLEAGNLTVTCRAGGMEVPVLRDIGFTVEPGRILGIVGESGAGKSMIGRVIARLLPPGFAVTADRLRFDGEDLLAASAERHRSLLGDRIAFVPQEPLSALNPVLTIGRQFEEHLARLGVPRRERRGRAVAALSEMRLPRAADLLARYPFQLSGGMCQRVLIAMAFASNPALIVADEPTTALDVTTQAHIVLLIRRLQLARNTGLLFITHDLRLAAHLCDEIMVLHAGDVVERGPAKAVFGQPRHPYTRALKHATPAVSGALRHLSGLPEMMPGLGALASFRGCRFASRCPVADPDCVAALPPLREIASGHWIRCTPGCAVIPEETAQEENEARAIVPAVDTPKLLRLEGIGKTYGRARSLFRRNARVAALRPSSLAIAPGESVGIVGESGSGKSTLARLILGLEIPTCGRILLDGADVTEPLAAWRQRIEIMQMVFQDPASALNPRRKVGQLATQALEARHRAIGRDERRAQALALLRDTGLPEDLVSRYPPQLSGGQRQRVNIARALCARPRLLVADEIVSGLDVSVQAQILNLLLRLRREHGLALLFISHDLAVVRYLCERVLVMEDGAIVEEGTTEAVFSTPRHPYTRMLLEAVPPDDLTRSWPPQAVFSEA